MNQGIKIALLALMLAAPVYLVPSPALTTEHTLYGACVALAALLAVLQSFQETAGSYVTAQ